ncbi:protein HEG [Hoplias malabaricus]|uniref:protein HEG n=1 Tax=Hoplias malabaricus TaxID=27720 RepID=UPI003461EDAC
MMEVVRRCIRVFTLLVLCKTTIAGRFAPRTDRPATDGDYLTFSGSTSSEETTAILQRLSTATVEFLSTGAGQFTTERFSDINPVSTEREANSATDQNTFSTDGESWTSHSIPEVSTELLSTSTELSTTTATEWENSSTISNITVVLAMERQPATEARTVRDLTMTELTEKDITDTDTTGSLSHTDRTYISTTISRAGERTLLSVLSNSTSSFSSSDVAPLTLTSEVSTGVTQGSDYNKDALSTEAEHTKATSINQLTTDITLETASVSDSAPEQPSVSQATHSQTGHLNVTGTSFEMTSSSSHNYTLPVTVVNSSGSETESTADASTSGTSYTDSSASLTSDAPFVSSEDGRTNLSQQTSETMTTRTPTDPVNTVDKEQEGPQTNKDETTVQGLTTTLPSLTTLDESLSKSPSGQQTSVPDIHSTPEATEILTTSSRPETQRPQNTEEDTVMASTVASTIITTIATSTLAHTTTITSSLAPFETQPSTTSKIYTSHVTPSTMETTQVLTTPTTEKKPPTFRTATLPHIPSSFQPADISTDVSTLHLETSTATPGNTTARERHTTASYSKSVPMKSTAGVTTGKHTERSSTQTEATTTQIPLRSTLNPGGECGPHTCANGGRCVSKSKHESSCECLPAWTGPFCTEDVNECERGSSPCPQDAKCVNTRGSFSCECDLGYDLEDGRTCTQAKTFLGTFSVNSSQQVRGADLHELHKEIQQLLNASLSVVNGYRRSTLQDAKGLNITAVNMFSMSANVTRSEILTRIQMFLRNCSKPQSRCTLKPHYQLSYQVESLCLAQNIKDNKCDTQSSLCNDTYGTPYCHCKEGFFKKNPEDTTCRDCGDGFQLVNGRCVGCTFGFGGFNCNNFYGLIAKVVAPAAGGLLLIVIIALIVTCCRRDKNDINKIIFKSGDLQMSPYAEFPKSSRVSMEWGRETIEMQENGSTKNLLQMTDIYYSPALRNADLERNGFYPFSGLPGSRHSCIYPAQWNPSFISDDSRRRDYF